ncbi:hypothetical protein TIFTF001_008929 [Ficus carica]|uniref:Uncharacterized protein n=1 Tax=Ficus carica TaxID=3494 RepID=A0AA87YW09_FICCA|nr:hypothetical protein TIFTF001_043769 [Ficus carica]GMN24323.1 hypothetical protein TIFTF001_043771 [Ficus carica]GMN39697.1 hypothetical protein TIFTF001_008929 [Ficus carica]
MKGFVPCHDDPDAIVDNWLSKPGIRSLTLLLTSLYLYKLVLMLTIQ